MTQVLWDVFFTHYGFPASILGDQGQNFESSLIKELCDLGTSVKYPLPIIISGEMDNANGPIPPW